MEKLNIGLVSVSDIVAGFGCIKVCTEWIPFQLMPTLKRARLEVKDRLYTFHRNIFSVITKWFFFISFHLFSILDIHQGGYRTCQQITNRHSTERVTITGSPEHKLFILMWIKRPTRCHFWYYVYFSFIGCSTCFGPPCAHLQELTTCSYLSDVLQSRGCVGSQIRLVACLSIGKHLTQLIW